MEIIDVHTHIFPPEFVARRAELAAREAWFGRLYASPKRAWLRPTSCCGYGGGGVSRAVTFGFAFQDAGCAAPVTTMSWRRPDNTLAAAALRGDQSGPAGRGLAEVEAQLAAGASRIGELCPTARVSP
jgi:hypothetical protein